jgi:hypothetical protein
MKFGIVLLLLVLLIGQSVHADQKEIQRPHWVIVVTIIDLNTGERVAQSKLGGPELEFDDLATCESVIQRVRTIPSEHSAALLKCRKVESRDTEL